MEEFVKTQGTLVYQGDIFETPKFSRAQVRKEVVKRKALFARWTSDFDSEKYDDGYAAAGKGWWYCLRQGTIDIDSLTAKQRYRVRRGLQNNNCYIATPEHIDEIQDELYDSYKASLADYPEVYKNVQSKEKLISWVRSAANSDRMDIWICRDKASGKVIGFAHVCSDAPLFHLSTVKLDPAYFKGEVNASLVYCIVNQYLGGGGICLTANEISATSPIIKAFLYQF